MKKTKLFLQGFFVLIFLVPILVIWLAFRGPGSMDFYIFADISECENLNSLDYEGAQFNKYSTSNNDKELGELKYNSFVAGKYTSEELDFEIFAYEFDSADTAKKYFKNVAGKSNDRDTTFSASSGFGLFGPSQYEIIVIDYERAYRVVTDQMHDEEIKKALGQIFSIKIN